MAQKESDFFSDGNFQDNLVALLCKDVTTLHRCAGLLKPDDFKPLHGMRHGRARWIIAERALEYYRKYHEPVDRLLRASYLEYATNIGLSERQVQELKEYHVHLKNLKLVGGAAIGDKVVHYKHQRLKAIAIQELIDLQASGQLTDEKWFEMTREAIPLESNNTSYDYFADTSIEDRIKRRQIQQHALRKPFLLIDPLDSLVSMVGPKELALCFGPWKRGKSMFLIWVAVAYILQRLNVLYLTLEDPQSTVEDRIDSRITEIPFSKLPNAPKTALHRLRRYRDWMTRTKLKIRDCTTGGFTMERIEQIVQQEIDHGFYPDAVMVDYDAKIAMVHRNREKRFDFDVYVAMQQNAARYNQIWWTGAQTQRGTEGLKILSGDKLAEDVGKIRNSTMAIGLGAGDWGEDGLFLWIAGHKNDRQHVGCNIMSDKSRSLIYDKTATMKKLREENHNQDEL